VFAEEFGNLMAILEERLDTDGGPFIAGRRFSMADCFVWPIVDEVVEGWEGWSEERFKGLAEWYRTTWKKKACVKKVREKLPEVTQKSVEKAGTQGGRNGDVKGE
jgi:glutathione S-transferase